MFYILNDLVSSCNDAGLASILSVIKKVITMIQIIAPILALVGGVLAATKLMTNPDEKKYKNALINVIIALVMVFLLPVVVNAVMGLLDNSFTISSCWNSVFINTFKFIS